MYSTVINQSVKNSTMDTSGFAKTYIGNSKTVKNKKFAYHLNQKYLKNEPKVIHYIAKNVSRRLIAAEDREKFQKEAIDRRVKYYSTYYGKFGHMPCYEVPVDIKEVPLEKVKSAMASQLKFARDALPYSLKKTLNLLEDYRRLFPKTLSELVLKENLELTKSPGTNRILRAWLSTGRVFSF